MAERIEQITWNGTLLAIILKSGALEEKTSFLTPSEINLQVGTVACPAGQSIARHVHIPLERRLRGTSEVIIVRKGACQAEIFNDHRETVATRRLETGDIVILLSGGHGFQATEDTVFLEIKQGPYIGLEEKERF
jgi:quercetin dioxygenase-like cupin family protein